MNAVIEEALALWGYRHASVALVAARENAVYRVDDGPATVALRLHRRGYRSDDELRSELQWMDAMSRGGISVPAPVASTKSTLLHIVDGVQVDVLTWLSGSPLRNLEVQLDTAARARIFRSLGKEMARLHSISDQWSVPDGFRRCAWDRGGLLGERPVWGRFWENPALSSGDRQLLCDARAKADHDLANIEGDLDYGLIHADLVSANVLVDGDLLHIIDFDDGGYGFRVFDVATALLKFVDDADYVDLKAALIAGYAEVRDIDLRTLDLFLLLRSATYVGWNIARMEEDGAAARNDRFIAQARQRAHAYLSH